MKRGYIVLIDIDGDNCIIAETKEGRETCCIQTLEPAKPGH